MSVIRIKYGDLLRFYRFRAMNLKVRKGHYIALREIDCHQQQTEGNNQLVHIFLNNLHQDELLKWHNSIFLHYKIRILLCQGYHRPCGKACS